MLFRSLALLGISQALPANQSLETQAEPKSALDAYMRDLERAMATGAMDSFDFGTESQGADFFD